MMRGKKKSWEARQRANTVSKQRSAQSTIYASRFIMASNNQSALVYQGAGNQCTPMAYMAMLYSTYRSPALWNTAILDYILKEGDAM